MLSDLPNAKWLAAGKQVILKDDFRFIEEAILEGGGQSGPVISPVWVDAATMRVEANADCSASMMFSGIPNVLNPDVQVDGGLTDKKIRSNYNNVSMIFGAGGCWGIEKISQLYAIFAIAASADTTFTLKAMPFMTVNSQAGQVIGLGTLLVPATGIGYGFSTDELAGGKLYVLSGASRGLIRTITTNNNDNGTGGTITYSGAALTLAQSDLFIVLPPEVNFRYLGCCFNDASGNIINANSGANSADFMAAGTFLWIILSPVKSVSAYGEGGGGGGGGGDNVSLPGGKGKGARAFLHPINYTPGNLLTIIVGAGGAGGYVGSNGSGGNPTSLNGETIGIAGDGGTCGAYTDGINGLPTPVLAPNAGYGGDGSLYFTSGGLPGNAGLLFLRW